MLIGHDRCVLTPGDDFHQLLLLQCMDNVTLRLVRVTIFALQKQNLMYILSVCVFVCV